MVTLEEVAQYALFMDDLKLRLLAQDFLFAHPDLSRVERPKTHDPEVLAVAAALLELFAMRQGQSAPQWTASVAGLDAPYYLNSIALDSELEAQVCREEAPEPLRKRNIFARSNFLFFV